MSRIRVRLDRIRDDLEDEIQSRLVKARLGDLLAVQARRRIISQGDSDLTYPELWATTSGVRSYRSGGKALFDTGQNVFNTLFGETEQAAGGPAGDSVALHLVGSQIAAWQDAGFETKGPNYIPLTKRASRFKRTRDAIEAGLVKGEDFIIARRGVKVPARPIFNMAVENRNELARQIGRAITNG